MSLLSNAARRLRTEISGSKNATSLVGRLMARFGRGSTSDLPAFMAKTSGYRHDLRAPIWIVGFGSSIGNGASMADPVNNAPVKYFARKFKAAVDPADRFNIQVSNKSVDGSTVIGFDSAWAAMVADGITPTICHFAYGMNDWQPAQFNSGQSFPGFYPTLTRAVMKVKKAGADVVLFTTPHAAIFTNPSIYSMPVGVPQNYPVDASTPAIPSPVAPEQLVPPASKSMVVADYLGEGVNVALDVRTQYINDVIRQVGREQGVLVIDSEKAYIQGLQDLTVETGSYGGAEAMLFNAGQIVHGNDRWHAVSYQRSTDEWVQSFAHQLAQGVRETTAGYSGMNAPGGLAAFDIRPPRGDVDTPPLAIWANNGPVDGAFIPTARKWVEVDPVNGDFVLGDGSQRFQARKNASGITISVEHVFIAYGVKKNEKIEGRPNLTGAWSTSDLPNSATGMLMLSAQNTGIATSPQVLCYRWTTKAGVLTLVADGAAIGSGVITVAVSGLHVDVTSVAANTNVQVEWKALTSG